MNCSAPFRAIAVVVSIALVACSDEITDETPAASDAATDTAEASAPDATTPDATTPDAATPDAATPDAATPDATTPDATTPDAGTDDAEASADATDSTTSEAGSDCDLPAIVDHAVIIPASCSPIDSDSVEVVTGGTLTLQAGVTIRFSDGAVLRVTGGILSVEGSAAAPVILEGQNPVKGAWQGVLSRYIGADESTVLLDHAIVRHGGFDGGEALACLTVINGVPDTNVVSVTSTRFEHCEVFGVLVPGPIQDFAAFEGVTITDSDVAMSLDPDVVGSVGPGLVLDDGAELQIRAGSLVHSQTWLPQSEPWILVQAINVDHPNAPVLTLAPGLELLVKASCAINVGDGFGGGLVAQDVTFGKYDGLWSGIRMNSFTSTSVLDGVTISGTGGPDELGGPPTGVLLQGTDANVTIRNSVFSDNVTDVFVDCGSTPLLQNNVAVVVQQPGC